MTGRVKPKRFPWAFILRAVAGAAILTFVLTRVDFSGITLTWDTRARIGFALTVIILFFSQVLSAIRWNLVLGREPTLPFRYLFRIYLIGQFFSFFLPTSVGGDAVRAVAVAKVSSRPSWALSSVVLERVLGLIAMFILLGIGALAAPDVLNSAIAATTINFQPTRMHLLLVLAGGMLLFAGFLRIGMRQPRIAQFVREAVSLWSGLLARPAAGVAAMVTSFLVQLSYIGAWYVLAVALRLPIPAADFLVFVPFVAIAAMLPVTIAGIGLREGAWVLLLARHGIPAANAVAYSLLYLVAFLLIGALGGVAFALSGIGRADTAVSTPSPVAAKG